MKKLLFSLLTVGLTPVLALAADVVENGAASKGAVTPFAGTIAQGIAAIVVFVVVLVVLRKTAWGPILKGLVDRENKIKADLEAAESGAKNAKALIDQHTTKLSNAQAEVQTIIARAQTDAENFAMSIRTRAQQEAEEIKERATREIDATKDAALADIYRQTADLSTSIAEKILKRQINATDQQDLVRASLDQLGKVSAN